MIDLLGIKPKHIKKGKSFTTSMVPASFLERWIWFSKQQTLCINCQLAVILQATATSDIVSVRRDFVNGDIDE